MRSPLFWQDSDSDSGILKKLGLRLWLRLRPWARIQTPGTPTPTPHPCVWAWPETSKRNTLEFCVHGDRQTATLDQREGRRWIPSSLCEARCTTLHRCWGGIPQRVRVYNETCCSVTEYPSVWNKNVSGIFAAHDHSSEGEATAQAVLGCHVQTVDCCIT